METGVNSVELSNVVVGVGTRGVFGRGRNTEAKNWFRASALAVEVVNDESARVMVSGNVDLQDLDLKSKLISKIPWGWLVMFLLGS